jgi:CRP/FNR family cyclic AMP-dependent transcriptional regulator
MAESRRTSLPDELIPNIQRGAGGLVFHKLSALDWERLFANGESKLYKDGELVCREGDEGDSLFFVVDGEVRVLARTMGGGGGAPFELARLGAGSVFGEMSFLDKAKISATVIAEGQVEVMRLRTKNIESLIDEDPMFGLRFYRSLAVTLSRRMRAANRMISDGY